MADNENTMDLGMNPYDHLVEKSDVPVQSPVILKNTEKADIKMNSEAPIELTPMAEVSRYTPSVISEYKKIYNKEILIEEELIVPDTYPDVEMILNAGGNVSFVDIVNESGVHGFKGEIGLEVMYRSDEIYGNNISVITAAVKFNGNLDDCDIAGFNQVHVKAGIVSVDCRLINERKYRIKICLTIEIKGQQERNLLIFDGIEGEKLFLKKENKKLVDFVSYKTRESEIRENLQINDEKIRPVKILKAKADLVENHRQLTKEKLMINQTIWMRIVYLAEISSKGNLSNQTMFFQGKIDHTQFIALGKDERDINLCKTYSSMDNVSVEINRESDGFDVSGIVLTDVEYYDYIDKKFVVDFYHEKEEMTCDNKTEKICADFDYITTEQSVKEKISLQQESGEEHRVIYIDSQITDPDVILEGRTAVVRGKLHLEVVTMNEGDYAIIAKKVCDFSCIKELQQNTNGYPELDSIIVRDMKCDILGSEINVTAVLQANLYIYNEEEINFISNPCVIKTGNPQKHYPLTIHTVIEGESIWEIGKKYKVSEDCIAEYNKPEDIRPGSKIIIVK